jgi:hypothetical protein
MVKMKLPRSSLTPPTVQGRRTIVLRRQDKATVLVKVRFLERDKRILPEMSAKVAFLEHEVKPEQKKPRLAVVPAALKTTGGNKVAYIIKDGRAVETQVTRRRSGDHEITSGLAGDKVRSGLTG